MRNAQVVIAEIKQRARAGKPLNSGANRGDWLYANAVRYLGSWRAAVETAGFDYDEVNQRRPKKPITREEVLSKIRELSTQGKDLGADLLRRRYKINRNKEVESKELF